MEDVHIMFLIDTGANITIIKPSVYERIRESLRPLLEDQNQSMVLADGRPLPFMGRGRFKMHIGPTIIEHDIWIANIEVDGILGLDFMRRHDCELKIIEGRYQLTVPKGKHLLP